LDVLPIHHEVPKTAHTATGVCQTAAATCCWQGRNGTHISAKQVKERERETSKENCTKQMQQCGIIKSVAERTVLS